jgi:hypothetical protein
MERIEKAIYLIRGETARLNRSQIVIGSEKHRDPRFRPYAFSEQGITMMSSVLRSKGSITQRKRVIDDTCHSVARC